MTEDIDEALIELEETARNRKRRLQELKEAAKKKALSDPQKSETEKFVFSKLSSSHTISDNREFCSGLTKVLPHYY